jgi:hypothetical protein
MASQTHLDILKQGVSPWNTWRKSNPTIVPDLSGADLSGRNLTEVNFSGANLTRTNLTNADLTGADLTGAILNETTGLAWQGKQF